MCTRRPLQTLKRKKGGKKGGREKREVEGRMCLVSVVNALSKTGQEGKEGRGEDRPGWRRGFSSLISYSPVIVVDLWEKKKSRRTHRHTFTVNANIFAAPATS